MVASEVPTFDSSRAAGAPCDVCHLPLLPPPVNTYSHWGPTNENIETCRCSHSVPRDEPDAAAVAGVDASALPSMNRLSGATPTRTPTPTPPASAAASPSRVDACPSRGVSIRTVAVKRPRDEGDVVASVHQSGVGRVVGVGGVVGEARDDGGRCGEGESSIPAKRVPLSAVAVDEFAQLF